MTGRLGGTRRQFLAGLAAVGGATVAGCGDLPWEDDTGRTFTAADAAAVVTDASPSPEWPVPVVPASSAVDDGIERVDALLADVPDPLDAETVPNGVVRKSIVDRRADARDHRADAAEATGDDLYRALRTTRDAREAARAATTTLAAIEDEGTVDALVAERRDVRSRVRNRLEAIEYGGDDADDERLRAALYYFRWESDLDDAIGRLDHRRWGVGERSNVIEIGDSAGGLEFASATAAVWDHLADRYEKRTDDPVDLTPVFDDAIGASIERIDAVGFPGQDDEDWYDDVLSVDLDDQFLRNLVWEAGQSVADAADGLNEAVAAGDRGTGLYEAVRFEQAYRAFERIRDRIEDGDLSRPDTADDVRAERTAALEALASARESLTGPSLGAYTLAETVQSFGWTDERVRRAADHDPETAVSLLREHTDYARLRAQLEVLPDAAAAVRERLLAG